MAKDLGDSVETVERTYLHPAGTGPADTLDRLFTVPQGGREVGKPARRKAAG